MNSIVLWIGAVVALFSCIMVMRSEMNDESPRESEHVVGLTPSLCCTAIGFCIMVYSLVVGV